MTTITAAEVVQLRLPVSPTGNWIRIKDADRDARNLYARHYSKYHYADGRQPKKFIGPGEYIALITPDCKALFAWRKFISMDNQDGVNCAIFRNESGITSSALILEAEQWAIDRWGHVRAYTYVNPRKIKSDNPGYCFKKAGWKTCGITKARKLLILGKQL